MQTCICRFHMCKYGQQIKTWSFCMCICVSAQQNCVFWQKKSANSHFSAKKDGAKPDTIFCKWHRPKKITALTRVMFHWRQNLMFIFPVNPSYTSRGAPSICPRSQVFYFCKTRHPLAVDISCTSRL